jgi:hypothetical protein
MSSIEVLKIRVTLISSSPLLGIMVSLGCYHQLHMLGHPLSNLIIYAYMRVRRARKQLKAFCVLSTKLQAQPSSRYTGIGATGRK